MGTTPCCQTKGTLTAELKCGNTRQRINSVKYIKAIKPESMVWYDEIMVNYEELKELERQQSTAAQNQSRQVELCQDFYEDHQSDVIRIFIKELNYGILSPKLVEIHENNYLNQPQINSQAYFPQMVEEENASNYQSANNENELHDMKKLRASTTVQFVIDCFTIDNIEEKSYSNLKRDSDVDSMLRSKSKERPRNQSSSIDKEKKLSQFMSKYKKRKTGMNNKKNEKQYQSNQTSLF